MCVWGGELPTGQGSVPSLKEGHGKEGGGVGEREGNGKKGGSVHYFEWKIKKDIIDQYIINILVIYISNIVLLQHWNRS